MESRPDTRSDLETRLRLVERQNWYLKRGMLGVGLLTLVAILISVWVFVDSGTAQVHEGLDHLKEVERRFERRIEILERIANRHRERLEEIEQKTQAFSFKIEDPTRPHSGVLSIDTNKVILNGTTLEMQAPDSDKVIRVSATFLGVGIRMWDDYSQLEAGMPVEPVIALEWSTLLGGGILRLKNEHGDPRATISRTTDGHGGIWIYDKYGEASRGYSFR